MAGVTFVDVTEERAGGYVDRLGYAICIGCHGAEREGAKWCAASNLRGTPEDHSAPGECDRCGRPFGECPKLVVDGRAPVEGVSCKIF